MNRSLPLLLALLCAAPAAGRNETPNETPNKTPNKTPKKRKADRVLRPGPDVQEELQEALILAKPGQVIELAAGTYKLTLGLSLSVDRVTLRGAGAKRTVLSFKGQISGSEGLLVTSHGVVLEDFAVVGAKGDAIKVKGAKGITFRRLRVDWPGPPSSKSGGYGLYPVQCRRVLIEDCFARGASDAGIYVGQSRRVIVRRCRVEGNVAGIEIENSRRVDVHGNTATANTGGILVFDLPNLPLKNGGSVRVFANKVFANKTPNFAPKGNIVRLVPRGTGMLVMANRGVEIFANDLRGHPTTNLLIVSYLVSGKQLEDPKYYPFPEAVHIHHNRFGPCGDDPDGRLGALAKQAIGTPVPDVVWDGAISPAYKGKLPAERRIVLHDNGDADFVDLDLLTLATDPARARPRKGLAGHTGSLPRLKPVRLGRGEGGAE